MVMFDLICLYFTVFAHILLPYTLLTIDMSRLLTVCNKMMKTFRSMGMNPNQCKDIKPRTYARNPMPTILYYFE